VKVVFAFAAALAVGSAVAQAQLQTVREGTGFNSPLFAASQPGVNSSLWVIEQGGAIRTLDLTGGSNTTPGPTVLVENDLASGGEQGLLGLAFHPNFSTNRQFYTYKTNASSNLEINRYTYVAGDATATRATRQTVLQIAHPGQTNHNGGWMSFGPDGYLYAAVGDGGGSNDPNNNAQNRNSLLGKMLRIDVDSDAFPSDATRNYAAPATNPGVGVADYADEIWALGLRNPWRSAFDRQTGDLWIADVGQGDQEEVNKQPAGVGGLNYGWDIREGTTAGPSNGVITPGEPLTDPIHTYGRDVGRSITGGYVYRGPGLFDGTEQLTGHYFFADYITGRIWTLEEVSPGNYAVTDRTAALSTPDVGGPIGAFDIVSFAQDGVGNLYIIDIDGEIFRIIPEPASLGLIGLGGLFLGRRIRRDPTRSSPPRESFSARG
jgi:hypothetical protein